MQLDSLKSKNQNFAKLYSCYNAIKKWVQIAKNKTFQILFTIFSLA